ncbi:FKBP-type peptidyl-prolyl cis-trans isomerase [Motiliproteus sp.]|uniref:FKBP-type peptidyl-prolyl cis-trans isomerase n=1 Tax=Motiliproteus sp. TaxID=1898955 RepID=UPI003BA84844
MITVTKTLTKLLLITSVALTLAGCDNELLSRIDTLEQQAEANAQAGQKFLAENGAKDGVISTDSGLQYRVLKSGTGPSPTLQDRVRAHYRGTLIDGSEFDSSYARGEAASFPVNGLIPGWQEALQLMKVGDHWELYVPSGLAYGKRSPSPKIPSQSTLIFELELVEIE